MLEKLLQAATITLLLNCLAAMSSPTATPKEVELPLRQPSTPIVSWLYKILY